MSPQIQPLDMQGYQINRLGAGVVGSDAARLDQTINSLTVSGTGLIVQTAANTWVTRSLVSTYALYPRVSLVSNEDGVAGNPTFDWGAKPLGGWIPVEATATYISATSLSFTTANTRVTPVVGDKVYILDNGGVKYFYITGLSGTTTKTVTLYGGIDYTLSNGPITEFFISHFDVATGFPHYFNWTPTYTAETGSFGTVTTDLAKFWLCGQHCYFNLVAHGTPSTTTGKLIFSLPITASDSFNPFSGWFDAGSGGSKAAFGELNSSTTVYVKQYDGTSFTNGAGRYIGISGFYRIA